MKKIFIDCDTGIDDSIGILYALKRKDVKIMGISTGFGNCSAVQGAENTLRLIKLSNCPYEIEVAVGAEETYDGKPADGYPTHIHGDNGIGNVDLPESGLKVSEMSAEDLIIKVAKENPGEVTLITLGRMTNLANALKKEPDLPKLYKNLVYMGGTVYANGNVGAFAEANIQGDAVAADEVMKAGFDATQVGLDVTGATRLSVNHLAYLKEHVTEENKPISDYINQAMVLYLSFNQQQTGIMDSVPVHDPLAVLLAIDPERATEVISYPLRVETKGEFTYGMTVIDKRLPAFAFEAKPVNVVMAVDYQACIEEIFLSYCK